jgi:hypothetical protein
MRLGFRIENFKRFYWNLATSSARKRGTLGNALDERPECERLHGDSYLRRELRISRALKCGSAKSRPKTPRFPEKNGPVWRSSFIDPPKSREKRHSILWNKSPILEKRREIKTVGQAQP